METFTPFDFHRIFFGDAPLLFLLEIIFRTLVMYSYTVFLLRILGKRGMGQLSMLELAILISFGSAVGDPMVGAEMPILHGIVAITTVTIFQIALEKLINSRPLVESVMEGKPSAVVKDGIIDWQAMTKNNISQEDLFRALRQKDIEQLGEVKTALFETSGGVSVFRQSRANTWPGLSTLPREMLPTELLVEEAEAVKDTGKFCCVHCGSKMDLKKGDAEHCCGNCAAKTFIRIEAND